jgi:hypothetical protein
MGQRPQQNRELGYSLLVSKFKREIRILRNSFKATGGMNECQWGGKGHNFYKSRCIWRPAQGIFFQEGFKYHWTVFAKKVKHSWALVFTPGRLRLGRLQFREIL